MEEAGEHGGGRGAQRWEGSTEEAGEHGGGRGAERREGSTEGDRSTRLTPCDQREPGMAEVCTPLCAGVENVLPEPRGSALKAAGVNDSDGQFQEKRRQHDCVVCDADSLSILRFVVGAKSLTSWSRSCPGSVFTQ